jgi:hypothetical protein
MMTSERGPLDACPLKAALMAMAPGRAKNAPPKLPTGYGRC